MQTYSIWLVKPRKSCGKKNPGPIIAFYGLGKSAKIYFKSILGINSKRIQNYFGVISKQLDFFSYLSAHF